MKNQRVEFHHSTRASRAFRAEARQSVTDSEEGGEEAYLKYSILFHRTSTTCLLVFWKKEEEKKSVLRSRNGPEY